jgi:hypothetical protein
VTVTRRYTTTIPIDDMTSAFGNGKERERRRGRGREGEGVRVCQISGFQYDGGVHIPNWH